MTTTRPLTLDIALTPGECATPDLASPHITYIVVDVIRATTTITLLFERGCSAVWVAPSVAHARAAANHLHRATTATPPLLAGEVNGLPPTGFHLGNSPAEVAARDPHDLLARDIIFASTNGARAIHACATGHTVLIGSLRNATAVARAALHSALATTPSPTSPSPTTPVAASEAPSGQPPADIVIVCAGRLDRPAYDDTICAAIIAQRIIALAADSHIPLHRREPTRLATATLHHAHTPAADWLDRALATSDAFAAIRAIDLAHDLPWITALDATTIVPALAPISPPDDPSTITNHPGLIRLRPRPRSSAPTA